MRAHGIKLFSLIILLSLLVPAGIVEAGYAPQEGAPEPPAPVVQSSQPGGVNPPAPNSPSRGRPDVTVVALAEIEAAGIPVPVTDFGDWSNDAATACIASAASVFVISYVASFIPFYGEFADPIAHLADLTLKYCAPVLYPDAGLSMRPSTQGQTCSYDLRLPANGTSFESNEIVAQYSNLMGIPISPRYYMVDWGQAGRPSLYHFNSNVDLILKYPGTRLNNESVSLPVGSYNLTWRGETLIDFLDFIYIPSPSPGYTKDQVKAMSKSKILRITLRRLIRDIVKKFYVGLSAEESALLEEIIYRQAADIDYGNRHGIYNIEYQGLQVYDENAPTISPANPPPLTLEALEPGGLSGSSVRAAAQGKIQFFDPCDPNPAVSVSGLPAFVPVDGEINLQWTVSDRGPAPGGGVNSATASQSIRVVDTKPPIILAPPDIVTETVSLPAALPIGHPATFDLVDLDPTVSHNACSQSGVVCSTGGPEFPAGQTYVTWTATDQSGNQASAVQLVNIKGLGTNHSPSANAQTGAGAAQAIAYEPITLTLTAQDPDLDPLWFQIETQPANGFFHAPLLPYFIQDYRLANVQDISFLEYCDGVDHRSDYIPTNWPVEANFMAVGDDGTVYVHDNGEVFCDFDGAVYTEYRLAVFRPDGTWDQVTSSFDVKDIFVDWRNGFIYITSTNVGSTYDWVRKYDLDLNLVQKTRIDYADNPINSPRQAIIDPQGLLYVSNGFEYSGAAQLYVYTAEKGPFADYYEPIYLADYSLLDKVFVDLVLDSQNYLYASERNSSRIYKWSPASLDPQGDFTSGELIGWLGKCDYGPGCDIANGRSFGFSCTDATCRLNPGSQSYGNLPGQFSDPRGIALDPNDILYVTDYNNQRVQRFTPDGDYAGQAVSDCDGSCFTLGDFGNPKQVTVNSNNFYVLDDNADLLHIFETTPLTRLNGSRAEIVYQAENNFVGQDQFSFAVRDGLATSAPATVEINVSRNHRPPQTVNGLTYVTDEDVSVAAPVDGYDPDEPLDSLTYAIEEPPLNGQLSGAAPDFTYLPDPDFNGEDQFSFTVSDGSFTSQPATVTLTVNSINDAPQIELSAEMLVGLGYTTIFSGTLVNPDPSDEHTLVMNWGDGSGDVPQGEMLEDGTLTGPLLIQNIDGNGTIRAEHTYTSPGTYTLQACVTDSFALQDCAATLVTVAPMADLALRALPSHNPLPLGESLSFDLQITHEMPDAGAGIMAVGVVISDTLGEYMSFGAISSSQGACDIEANRLVCTLGDLAPGATASVHINVQVDTQAELGTLLHNFAEASALSPDPFTPNSEAQKIPLVANADFIVNSLENHSDADLGNPACADLDGFCTLRAAIEQANNTPGRQSIALADQTYPLGDAPQGLLRLMGARPEQLAANAAGAVTLDIQDDLTLVGLGPDRSAIYGQQNDRLLSVQPGVNLLIQGVALSGGMSAGLGGALLNSGGAVTLQDVLVGNNQALTGGGIYNASGSLTIERGLFSGNRSDTDGGALYVAGGTANLSNVTFAAGEATGSGGAIFNEGTLNLTHVTVADNQAADGGGIYNLGTASLDRSLQARNQAGFGPDCAGAFVSQGYNLIGDASGCSLGGVSAGNLLNVDPFLDLLGANGGSTFTFSLLPGSPAIDHAPCVLAVDQRGVARPQGAACDSGAFEQDPVFVYVPFLSH